ncbi:hypothetical protein K2173_005915 [Erythroxylum novogranatense]|uniref:AB hydrolase-1 domain-containing protein n=1 Tax=Erythroxylum novogranatense TaxID=1862640 RepID=A0AAV8U6E0_9ROSI|nr:hypothetical protein K2173_005915 [Erythroxylum novogranatense]
MSVISNSGSCAPRDASVWCRGSKLGFGLNGRAVTRISMPYKNNTLPVSQLALVHSSKQAKDGHVNTTLIDERLANDEVVAEQSRFLAYDLVQGDLVKWSSAMDKSIPDPPTAVLLHGILGSRKNWGTFARRLAQEFPMWQFLLIDLRCHGDSTSIKKIGPHTVASAAFDVLKLVGKLRITPRVLIGHSFGGKVVLSMVDQAAKPLARPVKVWVLDATPGKVRAGGNGQGHPAELISFLRKLPKEVSSKREVVNALIQEGFCTDVAQWVVTNLRPSSHITSSLSSFSWVFDLDGISEMYQSYEETTLWKFVENLPRGVHVNFLKAERSLHRWALEDLQRIHAAEDLAAEEGGGVEMHVLEDAGHWFCCSSNLQASHGISIRPLRYIQIILMDFSEFYHPPLRHMELEVVGLLSPA